MSIQRLGPAPAIVGAEAPPDPVDTFQPGGNSGAERLLVEYRRMAQEQGRTADGEYRNKEAALPDDWRVTPTGANHTLIRNGIHDDPAFRVSVPLRRAPTQAAGFPEGKITPEDSTRKVKPDFGPLRPAGPVRTGTVTAEQAYCNEIPASTPKDLYPPNHPAMRAELEKNTTEAAVYAAENKEFRYEWLNRKVAGEWAYENEDFANFNKGACGAQLHISEKVLLSDGYREGRGYGDSRLSDRAMRMIRKGYAYASKGR